MSGFGSGRLAGESVADYLRRKQNTVDRAAPLCRIPADDDPSVVPDFPKLTAEESRALDVIKAAAISRLPAAEKEES